MSKHDHTPEERERVIAARAFIHAELCHLGHVRPVPCPSCPTGSGLLAALRLLDKAPRDAKAARRALHDVVCMSQCGPESDHADRTQTQTVAALRRFRAQETVGSSHER